MRLTADYWIKYINTHTSANKAAERRMERYIAIHGTEDMNMIADYAYALVSKYGEAASALSCEMYDQMARAQNVNVPEALPAETASYGEVARAVRGAGKSSPLMIPDAVGRLVKQAGADTTLQNAKRDGAYFAWIAHGDTCPYCMALAGLGWQKAGKLTLKGGHAEHIHANCDCEYAIDLTGDLVIEGYDHNDINQQLLDMTDGEYDAESLIRMSGHNAKGHDHSGLNVIRRKQYAANPEKIRIQQRVAYEKRRQLTLDEESKMGIQRGKNITVRKTTDGKYGLFISEDAVLKKQGLSNIEKAIDGSLKSLGIPEDKPLPQIIVLSDKEMGDTFASYNFVDNRLFIRDSMGDKRKTIKYQRQLGFADPNNPQSTAKHELIHWKDADEYRNNISEITKENAHEYLNYRNEQSRIKLDECGIDDSNVHTVSRYAADQYLLVNDFDEAYTEYRVLNEGVQK